MCWGANAKEDGLVTDTQWLHFITASQPVFQICARLHGLASLSNVHKLTVNFFWSCYSFFPKFSFRSSVFVFRCIQSTLSHLFLWISPFLLHLGTLMSFTCVRLSQTSEGHCIQTSISFPFVPRFSSLVFTFLDLLYRTDSRVWPVSTIFRYIEDLLWSLS